jgi:hypothetical protein
MTDDSILGGIFILKYELLMSTNSLRLIERVWNTIVILFQTTELLPCITSWPHKWVMLFVVILKDLTNLINLLNYWLWTGRSSQISCSKMHIICTKTLFNTAEKSSIYMFISDPSLIKGLRFIIYQQSDKFPRISTLF